MPLTLDSRPAISVIICTYNRCESLRQTLQTCCDLVIPAGVTWELLVVDNNSTDHTKQVCESFAGKLPLRYILEHRQGKSKAMNRAISEVASEFFLCTDDDVIVHPQWLASYWDAQLRRPEADFFGGKVLHHWEAPPPRYLLKNANWLRTNVYYHKGESERYLSRDEGGFYGPNSGYRKSVFRSGLRFPEDLGPLGGVATPAGAAQTSFHGRYARRGSVDFAFGILLATNGYRGYYVPAAVVNHRNDVGRQTLRFIALWYRKLGFNEVQTEGLPDNPHLWFRVPRYLWRNLVENSLIAAVGIIVLPSRIWLAAYTRCAWTWGAIAYYRQAGRGQ